MRPNDYIYIYIGYQLWKRESLFVVQCRGQKCSQFPKEYSSRLSFYYIEMNIQSKNES